MPSAFTLHFIRVKPVASCFLATPLSSISSPGFSLRVDSLIFRVSSFGASMSKPGVKMVSFTTLKSAPSFRNRLPWFPATVAQPSRSSCMARTRTRFTSACSSFTGPSSTCTTSPHSKRRSVVASRMLMPSVIATSFVTFMSTMSMASKTAFDTAPDFSSSSPRNARCNSSSDKTCESPPAGSPQTKEVSSLAPKLSAPLAAIASKSASAVRLLAAWCSLSAMVTLETKALTSTASFRAASARNFSTAVAARCTCVSNVTLLALSFFFSASNQAWRAASTSMPVPNSDAAFMMPATFPAVALTFVSASSAFASISVAFKALPSVARACDCLPVSATSSSTSLIDVAISSTFACSCALLSASSFSWTSRILRLS
mmetsp:Transcript_36801/g.105980  ORF Transcript_36801/g.105980 Transcript_36801/m.105980 type:complete len:373 (+) Transcript_36801:200-1318(+)